MTLALRLTVVLEQETVESVEWFRSRYPHEAALYEALCAELQVRFEEVDLHLGPLVEAPPADIYLWLARAERIAATSKLFKKSAHAILVTHRTHLHAHPARLRTLGGIDEASLTNWWFGRGESPDDIWQESAPCTRIVGPRPWLSRWSDYRIVDSRHGEYIDVDCPMTFVEAITHYVTLIWGQSTAEPTVDHGRFTLGERVRAGATDEVRLGWSTHAPDVRVLVTLTDVHSRLLGSADRHDERYWLPVRGIAKLERIGRADPGVPYEDALVERLPPGRPAIDLAPIAEADLVRLGADVARVIGHVHLYDRTVHGIRPELIYVTDESGRPRFAGLVPRGPGFIAAALQTVSGPRSYPVPYLAPEALTRDESTAKSDVFALCATVFFLGTRQHPFGDLDDVGQIARRLIAGVAAPWPGGGALGEILSRGLARDPATRPTALELAAALEGMLLSW